MLRHDGSARIIRLESVSLDGPEAETWRCFTAMIDLTERSEAEDALRRGKDELGRLNRTLQEANVRKDEFLAMLAHELRNPLAAIDSALRLAMQPVSDHVREESQLVAQRQPRCCIRSADAAATLGIRGPAGA